MSRFTIYGARGSYPVSGERIRRYGGSTSCFSLETSEGLLIIDAGTGLATLSEELTDRAELPPITLLFTHLHLDHIIGLLAFKPLLRKDAQMTLIAGSGPDWPRTLTTVIGKPFWPVNLPDFGASIRFETLPDDPLTRHGVRISHCAVSHPQGCVGYRLEAPDRTVVIATDREHGDSAMDRALIELSRGAEVLIHDAQYTPEEYAARRGWGHSTWEHSAQVAAESRAGRLVLVSHDPSRSDEELDALVERARRLFPNTVAAFERLTFA